MTDYMKEAERMADAYAVAYMDFVRCGKSDHEDARAALLAHIQRGVPEGWQLVPIDPMPEMLDAAGGVDWGDEDMRGSCCNQWHAMLAAAPAPDQFRNAAKMMAVQPSCMTCGDHGMIGGLLPNGGGYESDPCPDCTAPAPAEVPMPDVFMYGVKEPDGGAWMQEVCVSTLKGDVDELVDDLNEGRDDADTRYTSVSLVTTEDAKRYGDAREAAGYARGLKEAGRLISLWLKDPDVQRMLEFARDASRKVTSWPDRLNGEAEDALRGEVKP